MRLFRIILVCFLFFFIASCSTKKKVLYFQDIEESEVYSVDYKDYQIKVDDILKIDVNTSDPELALEYNRNSDMSSNNLESIQLDGYQVNNDGIIFFSWNR